MKLTPTIRCPIHDATACLASSPAVARPLPQPIQIDILTQNSINMNQNSRSHLVLSMVQGVWLDGCARIADVDGGKLRPQAEGQGAEEISAGADAGAAVPV